MKRIRKPIESEGVTHERPGRTRYRDIWKRDAR